MSFDKALQKQEVESPELAEALLKIRAAKVRYKAAASKHAKARIACVYPGAPDAALAAYYRAREEFSTESKIHSAACAEYIRVLQHSGKFKEPTYSVEEYVSMQEQTNTRTLDEAVKNVNIIASLPLANAADIKTLAIMDKDARLRYLASGKSLDMFMEEELKLNPPPATVKELNQNRPLDVSVSESLAGNPILRDTDEF